MSTNIHIDGENTTNFIISVGDLIRLTAPSGYPKVAYGDDVELDEDYILNGFVILDQSLGQFEGAPSDDSDNAVLYRHTKSGRQTIRFDSYGLVKIYFYAVLQGITVHDHASIPQGGPAFATYYSDNLSNREEE